MGLVFAIVQLFHQMMIVVLLHMKLVTVGIIRVTARGKDNGISGEGGFPVKRQLSSTVANGVFNGVWELRKAIRIGPEVFLLIVQNWCDGGSHKVHATKICLLRHGSWEIKTFRSKAEESSEEGGDSCVVMTSVVVYGVVPNVIVANSGSFQRTCVTLVVKVGQQTVLCRFQETAVLKIKQFRNAHVASAWRVRLADVNVDSFFDGVSECRHPELLSGQHSVNGDALGTDCSRLEKIKNGEHGVLRVIDKSRPSFGRVQQGRKFWDHHDDLVRDVFFPPVDHQDDV